MESIEFHAPCFRTKKLTRIWLNKANVIGVAEDANDHHAIVHIVSGGTIDIDEAAEKVADRLLTNTFYKLA